MKTLNINHNPLDWRLYIDSSKLSPKAVFLHNTNTLPSIPVGHSEHNKESYENVKFWWKPLIMINSNDKSVLTWKWLPFYLDYNKDLQNIAATFVNGTAELDLLITQEKTGLPENLWNQESWMWKINH